MTLLNTNLFKAYVKTQSTLIRISNIRNHKLKGQVIAEKPNQLKLDFGHYKQSKVTTAELYQCFKYNRRIPVISDQTDILNNKINFILKERTPQENPILQSPALNPKPKDFTAKLNSITLLKQAFVLKKLIHGRIIKKINGGFLIITLGVFAFLPASHFISPYNNRRYKGFNIKRTKLLFAIIPLEILGIKCLKSTYTKPDYYFLSIVVSLKKALKTLEKHHKLPNIKKLVRINKLKNCKNFKSILKLLKITQNAGF